MASDIVIAAAIAAVPPTLASIVAVWSSLRNGRRAKAIIEETAEIHALTNSQLTNVKDDLKAAKAEIHVLCDLILNGENKSGK